MTGMGQNNRARRATKQRKQQRAAQGRPTDRPAYDRSSTAPDAIGLARDAIGQARLRRFQGVAAQECVHPLLAMLDDSIDKAVDLIFGDILSAMFKAGWTPLDLAEVSRRRVDGAGTGYVLDAVAAVTDGFPAHLVDPRWRAQLDRYDARLWWDARLPQLAQWAAGRGISRRHALAVVIDVITMLDRLTRLQQVLPAPGSPARAASPHAIDPAQEKVLAKVRSLLAKAESTEFEEEANALSAKAQELMSRYALDHALVDHARGVRQEATLIRIWLDNPYLTPKALLVDAVASANRCRTLLAAEVGYVTVIGDDLDLRLVELLTTSLLVQGTRAMLAAGAQLTRNGTSRTRSFRQSFLVAYAGRIGERLRTANRTGVADADDGRLLPVLSERTRAVDDLIERQFPNLVPKKVSVSNAAGWGAGVAAADLARLNVHDALDQTG
jgi:Protein of unknown function (DUF2786)